MSELELLQMLLESQSASTDEKSFYPYLETDWEDKQAYYLVMY